MHFDFLAPYYDRLLSPPADGRLIELMDLPEQGIILDAGGGTGRIAQLLTGGDRRVIVQDYSHNMLNQARSKDGIKAVNSETEGLPFPEGTFDRVVIVDAYHHLRDQERSLRELWRVLKTGGTLVIEEPDIRHWGVKLAAFFEKLILMRSHFEPPGKISSVLEAMGADPKIITHGYTSWVIAFKPPGSS